MKDSKNDSTPVLERFARDKRKRTVIATAERVERRPRLQRDAADSEQPSHPYRPEHRASYNPHFTADNRPRFDRSRQEDEERPRRAFGDRENRYGEERPQRNNGEREYRYGRYGDEERPQRAYGDRPRRDSGERSQRSASTHGPKPACGEKRTGKFDDRKGLKGGKFATKGAEGRTFDKRSRKGADKPVSYPKYDPAVQTGEMRLNRFIAQSGICSRREADDFITAGVVTVNGKVVTELGTKVLPTDEVRFNGEPVHGEKKVYLVLNKPKGYVTSLDDPHAGKTVMELVKGACTERIYPVGRLDKNSLGLLLFTNDGDLTKQLTHPSYRKKKIYQVTLDKPLTRADMDRIAEGITLEDGEIFADEISYVKENKQEVGIEIHSGRNRIVRRIFEFLGYTVTKLDRVYYAGLTKKNLKRGAWRFLTREEVERLKSGLYE
ncbi:pseudouridine synthase [uncultured Alistipes sp.]|uniref:pseudouridine synthase n=1 Tax=uncultured Alistipes sp. TaxID=538949 RepID=UPI00320BAD96